MMIVMIVEFIINFLPVHVKTFIIDVSISFPVIEIHGNTKSRGAGGPAEKDLERHRLKIDPRRSKNNKSLISLTTKVSLKRLTGC